MCLWPSGEITLIPLSVLFSFPVLFWCRFYPRFFLSAQRAFGGSKKRSFDEKSVGRKFQNRGTEPFLGRKSAEKGKKKPEKLRSSPRFFGGKKKSMERGIGGESQSLAIFRRKERSQGFLGGGGGKDTP